MNSRIHDGSTVTPHAMPWQAAIMKPRPKDCKKPCKAILECGGSILCPNYVISAAHCSYICKTMDATITSPSYEVIVAEAKPRDQHVRIGTHDFVKDLGKEYAIQSITIHPIYYAKNNKPVDPPRRPNKKGVDLSLYKLTR